MKLMLKDEELPISEYEGFKKNVTCVSDLIPKESNDDQRSLTICKNRKLALYTTDQINNIENLKIPCNVVAIETGYISNFAMILSKYNPFTDVINFHIHVVSEVEEYGKCNSEEKTWSGGIAELYARRADICISNFIINSNKSNAVDFTHPVFKYKNILVIRKPTNLTIQWSSHFLIR
uniref:Ionotropic glutamate receptor L-glutamate and glycine-binding domain-containing protein n=1 Tax=Vespula pensylvanica TaxID=30213 RepID=A0A834K1T8_VESPE|nr:hypothetical protein H0235_016298 [Vespula pensylvanica]